jgi:hypothetical protein
MFIERNNVGVGPRPPAYLVHILHSANTRPDYSPMSLPSAQVTSFPAWWDTLCGGTLFHPDLRRQASATAQS